MNVEMWNHSQVLIVKSVPVIISRPAGRRLQKKASFTAFIVKIALLYLVLLIIIGNPRIPINSISVIDIRLEIIISAMCSD